MLKLPLCLLLVVAASAVGSEAQTRPLGTTAEPGGTGQVASPALPWLLLAAVTACRRALDYYGRHTSLMNLDALLGTRVAEGVCVGGDGRGHMTTFFFSRTQMLQRKKNMAVSGMSDDNVFIAAFALS